MIVRSLVVWFVLVILAIANGAFRERVLSPRIGAPRAHVASTILLAIVILLVTFSTIDWLAPATSGQALGIGAVWVVLVLAFEFGFGRLVARKTWKELLADYDLGRGRIWVLVPVVTLLAPYLAARSSGLL